MKNKTHIDLNDKTILVTGSPGFIGANLVLRLLKEMSAGCKCQAEFYIVR